MLGSPQTSGTSASLASSNLAGFAAFITLLIRNKGHVSRDMYLRGAIDPVSQSAFDI